MPFFQIGVCFNIDQLLVNGARQKMKSSSLLYECLVGCFEFSDDRMIVKKKDGTIAVEYEWDSTIEEKSFRNEKLTTALRAFFETE